MFVTSFVLCMPTFSPSHPFVVCLVVCCNDFDFRPTYWCLSWDTYTPPLMFSSRPPLRPSVRLPASSDTESAYICTPLTPLIYSLSS